VGQIVPGPTCPTSCMV